MREIKNKSPCKIEECPKLSLSKGMCGHHYDKQKYAKNRDKRLLQMKARYHRNREKNIRQVTDAMKLKRYNVSPEQYQEMHNKQKGLCAICNNPETRAIKRKTPQTLSIDHCHKSGKVRELLCSNCNLALGNTKEDIRIVINLLEYIKKHNK